MNKTTVMICAAALCAGSTLNPAWAQSAEDDPPGKHLDVPGAKTTLPVEVVKEPSIINLNHKMTFTFNTSPDLPAHKGESE